MRATLVSTKPCCKKTASPVALAGPVTVVLDCAGQAPSTDAMDTALAGIGSIAPGFWMLTGGSLLVLFMVIKGILGGASQAKAAKAEAAGARKRR